MELLKILTEHSHLSFTGRINILDDSTSQFIGAIFLKEGRIVGAEFSSKSGKKGLMGILYQYFNATKKLKHIPEPELIEDAHLDFNLSIEQFKHLMKKFFEDFKILKKFEPARNLKLDINPHFISNGPTLTSDEYKILDLICGGVKISDIYNQLEDLEYEISQALISLRKKGALKVVKSYIIE